MAVENRDWKAIRFLLYIFTLFPVPTAVDKYCLSYTADHMVLTETLIKPTLSQSSVQRQDRSLAATVGFVHLINQFRE